MLVYSKGTGMREWLMCLGSKWSPLELHCEPGLQRVGARAGWVWVSLDRALVPSKSEYSVGLGDSVSKCDAGGRWMGSLLVPP